MDLKETEAKNDCTGEAQQQFSRPTDLNRPTHFSSDLFFRVLKSVPYQVASVSLNILQVTVIFC
jgi:hypothetical protein